VNKASPIGVEKNMGLILLAPAEYLDGAPPACDKLGPVTSEPNPADLTMPTC